MLISFNDIKVGDEIVIPSNSKLKYLKVLSKTASVKSFRCSAFRGDRPSFWGNYIQKNVYICQPDSSSHNDIFYLRDDNGYTDIWLVRREQE